ncbi:hypothetical protein Aros01_07048 [Streptosporangium roseum]
MCQPWFMATARWNGEIIAESDDTRIVEGNHYFPIESVSPDYLRPSETTTVCSWKGTASYYTLHVGGEDNPDAAWYYADPKPEAAQIKGYVAFWKGVEVTG